MSRVRRKGTALPPGTVAGEILQWDGQSPQWGQPASVVPEPPIELAPLVFYQNFWIAASQLPPIAGARQRFAVESLAGADGTPIALWPDTSGNGLDVSNTGGADRPLLGTDEDGVRSVRFDGVDDFLSRTGMASPAVPNLTVFLVGVLRPVPIALRGPWGFARAGFTSFAAGAAGGEIRGTDFSLGARGQNVGGSVAYQAASTMSNGSPGSDGGAAVRRAMCYQFRSNHYGRLGWLTAQQPSGRAMWSDLGAGPGGDFNFTNVALGAQLSGVTPINLCQYDMSYFSYHVGAAPVSYSSIRQELIRLAAYYRCT